MNSLLHCFLHESNIAILQHIIILQQNNLEWFPRMRTLSLAVDAEGESEQNDVKILQEKLDNTTKQVQALSTQLKELREQVFDSSVKLSCKDPEMKEELQL